MSKISTDKKIMAFKGKHLVHYKTEIDGSILEQVLLLLLLQSALQPLWVMACSTIAEYSQQESLYRVPLPKARQTPNLEDQ